MIRDLIDPGVTHLVEVHLSFCQFGPVWVQVVDNPVKGARQRDSVGQEDDQDGVGEQSREVDHLERQQTPQQDSLEGAETMS